MNFGEVIGISVKFSHLKKKTFDSEKLEGEDNKGESTDSKNLDSRRLVIVARGD